jgi:hypothetical protein
MFKREAITRLIGSKLLSPARSSVALKKAIQGIYGEIVLIRAAESHST